MNRTFKRASIVAGGVGAIASISIASFAFFTASTSVVAQGETQTVQPVRVTGAVVETLHPGVCADVTFTLNNDSNILLTGVSGVQSVALRADGGAAGHLHLASYLHNGSTATELINGGGYVFEGIPANGSKVVTFKNAVCMDLGADNTAQGQAVAVDLELIVKQANGGEYTSVS
jgi:hypothetical protein